MFDIIQGIEDWINSVGRSLNRLNEESYENFSMLEDITEVLPVIQEKLDNISLQLSNISTWLYILAGLGALLLVLQIVILVKIMKKSNTTTNRKQLPAPKGEADGEVIE